jgi:pimeloyl-ACP methyl ester carboxylesterase
MSVTATIWLWLKRLTKTIALLLVVVIGASIGYEQFNRYSAASEFPPPGRMVNVEGYDMHLHCTGTGSPVVLLESGLTGLGSMQWYVVQPAIAKVTTVCSYDRAGILWSDRRARPRTGDRMIEELGALLDTAEVPPPYVMVGHSLGGGLIRMFDERFPGTAAGFVFIDSGHEDQLTRMPQNPNRTRPPPDWLLTAFGATGLIRSMSAGTVKDLPTPAAQAVEALSPYSVHGQYGEMASIEDTTHQLKATAPGAPGSLGSRPVVVLTRTQYDSDEIRMPWMAMQAELAALSTNSDHRLIAGATHFIHLDDPEAVVQAIRDVVLAARDGASVAHARATP